MSVTERDRVPVARARRIRPLWVPTLVASVAAHAAPE